MPSYQPDPNAVFSKDQWNEIAQSIGLPEIPKHERQEISDALFEYTIAGIKTAELTKFVDEAREFRASASRIQNFLKKFSWHQKFEGMIEDIYELQRFVDEEFRDRPQPQGGRPRSHARDTLVYRLKLIYERMTGRKAGRSENPDTGELTGPFPRFVKKIFQLHGIDQAGLKHAIDAARNAGNLLQQA